VTPDQVWRLRGDDPDVVRAAELGKHETVKQLIALGAHLDVEGCGRTDDSALMAAVRSGSKETVEVLLAAGADVNRGIETHADDTIVETALTVAVASGNRAIVKLLLDHRADVKALNHSYHPSAEKAVALLFDMGESAHARDLGQAATGVELPQPDADLLEQGRKLGSLFTAFATRFNAQGDRTSAERLCEWKLAAWEAGSSLDEDDLFLFPDAVGVPIQIPVCLRTLAEIKEAKGELQEAIRLYRKVLRTWRYFNFEVEDAYDVIFDGRDEAQGSSADAWRSLFSDAGLQSTVVSVPEGWHTEFATLLRDCERILGRLGMAEEQGRVAVAIERLGSEKP